MFPEEIRFLPKSANPGAELADLLVTPVGREYLGRSSPVCAQVIRTKTYKRPRWEREWVGTDYPALKREGPEAATQLPAHTRNRICLRRWRLLRSYHLTRLQYTRFPLSSTMRTAHEAPCLNIPIAPVLSSRVTSTATFSTGLCRIWMHRGPVSGPIPRRCPKPAHDQLHQKPFCTPQGRLGQLGRLLK